MHSVSFTLDGVKWLSLRDVATEEEAFQSMDDLEQQLDYRQVKNYEIVITDEDRRIIAHARRSHVQAARALTATAA